MYQALLIFAGGILLTIPAGWYLYRVAEQKYTYCDAFFDPLDSMLYALCRIDKKNMDWKQYALAILIANCIMVFMGYLVLRTQGLFALNPNHIMAMEPDLSFNTVISFMTNTNLQHYAGESGLSCLSQMLVITSMMFTSAATGCAACMAFLRGVTGRAGLGNFYVDMIRITTRVLLPLAVLVGLVLVTQGVPQNFSPTVTLSTLEGAQQDLAMGPVASLESIKHLGTNGGGFSGANSSTPQENPTIISNMVEMCSMMLLPGACVVVFGLMLADQRRLTAKQARLPGIMGKEARSIFLAMTVLFLLGLPLCFFAESAGNPALEKIGLSQTAGNMEGKEVRFGIAQTALFATVTTSFTTGSVNAMHDSLTPLASLTPMLHMMLNVVFGGIGVGLMNMMMYVLLTVFICGLMIGRTPEYLGRKIEGREMKLVTLVIILHPLLILGASALALVLPQGLAGISNPGFHGLSQILYEYASSAANNGSGFEGLADNTLFWNISTGLVMFYGRYIPIVLQLAIAGSLMSRQHVSLTAGTLRSDTLAFPLILVFMVLIFAALTFFPALALGPVAEHLTLGK